MHHVFLYDAVRSPRTKGRPGGALAPILPHQLVAQIIEALRDRMGQPPIDAIERFVLSCVGQVGPQGGNLALVSKLEAGLPPTTATQTINNFCVGGMTALITAASFVRSGDSELALAGGVEMMSHVPFLGDEASYYTDAEVAAHLQYAPVGVAADLLAHRPWCRTRRARCYRTRIAPSGRRGVGSGPIRKPRRADRRRWPQRFGRRDDPTRYDSRRPPHPARGLRGDGPRSV